MHTYTHTQRPYIHTRIRMYRCTYTQRVRSLSLAPELLRLVRAGSTLVLPFSSLLASSSANDQGEVSRRPPLILSRRSTASTAVSLSLSSVSFLRLSHTLSTLCSSLSHPHPPPLSLEQPINSVGRRRVRTTILSLSSHRPTVLTPI